MRFVCFSHIDNKKFRHHFNPNSLYDEIYKEEINETSSGYDKLRVMERCTRKWKFSESAILSCSKIVEDFRFLLHAETYNLILKSFENFEIDNADRKNSTNSERCVKYPNEADFINYLHTESHRIRPGTILKKMFIQDQHCIEKQTWEERAAIFRQAYTR